MTDRDCIEFLKWSLPRLRMRWQGFKKVRSQVCKRISRRLAELGLQNISAYRQVLEKNTAEWKRLDSLCIVTISRFYRDREVFLFLEREVLAALWRDAEAHRERELRFWSIGCAAGEEPYTLALLGNLAMAGKYPELSITILATDVDPVMIRHAEEGCYKSSSYADLPAKWRKFAFSRKGELSCIREEVRGRVTFLVQDIRKAVPEERFHLILCRNLAFTYFDPSLQREVLERINERLKPGGSLVIGIHETLPEGYSSLKPWPGGRGIFRKEAR